MDGRKVWSTVWVGLGGIGMLSGLVLDFPQATQRILMGAPEWIRSPDAYWIVVILLVEVAILRAIWSAPSHCNKLRIKVADQFLQEFNDACREVRQMANLKIDSTWHLNYLKTVAPEKMEYIGGKECRVRYETVLTRIAQSVTDTRGQFAMIEPWIHQEVEDAKHHLASKAHMSA